MHDECCFTVDDVTSVLQVVTKIKTVEVESDGLRVQLEECANALSEANIDNKQLRAQISQLEDNCNQAHNQLKENNEKVS